MAAGASVTMMIVRATYLLLFSPLVTSFPTHGTKFRPASHRYRRINASWLSPSSAVNHERESYSASSPSASASASAQSRPPPLLDQFASDLALLEKIRPNLPSKDFSAPIAMISAGSSYTRLWTHETWRAHSSREPIRRYARHVTNWPASTTARKIVPVVALSAIWSLGLSVVARAFQPLRTFVSATGPSAAISYLAAPLALLLTLRANASMSRIVEARLLWGRLVLHVRSLAGILSTYLLEDRPNAAVRAARHLVALGWMLKASVRGESTDRENEVLSAVLSREDREWVALQPRRTAALLSRIRRIASKAIASLGDTARASAVLLLVEERIAELELCVGGCDRLFTSPIPPTYSRHLSRVMFLWLLLLPMSLMTMNLSLAGVVLPTAVATYVLVGIDEVGIEIENAFWLLPLQQLATTAQNGVRDQIVPASGPMPNDEF